MRAQCSWSKVILVAACLAAAGAGGFLAVRSTGSAHGDERVGAPPSPSDAKYAEDEKAIQKNQAAYVKAFNAGDAKGTAAFWAADGEFVDADGKSFKGRNAIAKEFASFFAESKGLKLEVSTDSLRFVSPDVALESGTTRVTRASDGDSNVTSYQIVHTKRDGQWQLASVRESNRPPSSNYEQLRGLEWLVGNWTAKGAGQSLELTCEWAAKRNFLLRRYTLSGTDGTVKTGIQIIGWDPAAGEIRSWLFDSDGGYGSERWARDGKRWVLEATGVTRDGAQLMATNVLTPVDHDSFSWQSVRRVLNQVRLPDTPVVKATRVKARG
jgi:uncharacterized protein (TIGR02246 family)